MDDFLRLIAIGDPRKVKDFIKKTPLDINRLTYTNLPGSGIKRHVRPIDVAWIKFSEKNEKNFEDILELLVNENSMYPQPFHDQSLSPGSKLRTLFSASRTLHNLLPGQIVSEVKRHKHLYYFFDEKNQSLLFRLWMRKVDIPIELSKCLLLGPHEYFLLDGIKTPNLLMKLKSLLRVNTQFERKCTKQTICAELSNGFSYVKNRILLSAIVMYPIPLTLIFDYTQPVAAIRRVGLVFFIGCRGNKLDLDQILDYVCNEIFDTEHMQSGHFNEFCGILAGGVDKPQHFKLDNRNILFQGRFVEFQDIKPMTSLGASLMKRILFDVERPVSIGMPPPLRGFENIIDIDTILKTTDYYSTVKVLRHFDDTALFEVYHALRDKKPHNWWLWYIDLSVLPLDQFCTAHTLLKTAYVFVKRDIKTNPIQKFGWEVFLQMYSEHRCVLLFGGVDRLAPELHKRVLQIIQYDFICERWISTNDCLIRGPQIDLHLLLHDVTPRSLNMFSELLGNEYSSRCYYPPNDGHCVAVFTKKSELTPQTILRILSIEPKCDERRDDFSCIQVNLDLFVRYNGMAADVTDPIKFKSSIAKFQSKTMDLFENERYIARPCTITKKKVRFNLL